jgi:hypothetical protein
MSKKQSQESWIEALRGAGAKFREVNIFLILGFNFFQKTTSLFTFL